MKNIVVVGAGTMGNGIAHTFAQSGFKVNFSQDNKDTLSFPKLYDFCSLLYPHGNVDTRL